MRLTYRRSGGLAGIDLTADAKSDDLPSGQADVARQLLTRAATATRGASVPQGADQFSYTLELDDGTRHRTFHWMEHEVPGDVQPLLTALQRRAHPSPPSA
jgi:Emfourin